MSEFNRRAAGTGKRQIARPDPPFSLFPHCLNAEESTICCVYLSAAAQYLVPDPEKRHSFEALKTWKNLFKSCG
jgi:hypothetical protein